MLGAILIDGGVTAARKFVKRHLLPTSDGDDEPAAEKDSKTALLHWCQHHRLGQPRYELVETVGLQHEQEFVVRAKIESGSAAEARARTKRAAEKLAAAQLLASLRGE